MGLRNSSNALQSNSGQLSFFIQRLTIASCTFAVLGMVKEGAVPLGLIDVYTSTGNMPLLLCESLRRSKSSCDPGVAENRVNFKSF
jgi:hypothetical protein